MPGPPGGGCFVPGTSSVGPGPRSFIILPPQRRRGPVCRRCVCAASQRGKGRGAEWLASIRPRPTTFWTSVVAILGTTISPYLFFWQASQEVEDVEAPRRLPAGHRES